MPRSVLVALFWVAVAACAVAQLFILRAVLRSAPPAAAPSVPLPRRAQEIAWAILPGLLLAACFLLAWRAMQPDAASAVLPS